MKLSPKKYAESLLALCLEYSHKEVEQAVEHMVTYFTRRGKLKFLRMVRYELSRCIKKQQEHIDATISSAHDISKHTLQELQQVLGKHFSSTVTLDARTNPDLIAGSIITIEDRMIDSSLAARLNLLKTRFSS